MRRRDFITLLGGATAWPLAARAQTGSGKLPTIGWLDSNLGARVDQSAAFSRGLAEADYVVGRNVNLEHVNAEGDSDRLRALAADFVRRQVAVIVATSGAATQAAKEATPNTPIVFILGENPVESGFVASFNRPGGNVTGVTTLATEIAAKRLELLHELVPKAHSIGAVVVPESPTSSDFQLAQTRGFQSAALALGLRLLPVVVATEVDIAAAFAGAAQQGAGALLVGANRPFATFGAQMISAANRLSLPTMFFRRDAVAEGALVSYGTDFLDISHLVGVYIGRVLKGDKPADLPVQQPIKFDLAINLKTARGLGMTVPLTLLALADEVIE